MHWKLQQYFFPVTKELEQFGFALTIHDRIHGSPTTLRTALHSF
jgi:hypothetical protein